MQRGNLSRSLKQGVCYFHKNMKLDSKNVDPSALKIWEPNFKKITLQTKLNHVYATSKLTEIVQLLLATDQIWSTEVSTFRSFENH